jgi:hypothetical protein
VPEVRRLLHAGCPPWSRWRRRHQAAARRCHIARRASAAPSPETPWPPPAAVPGLPALTTAVWQQLAPALTAPPPRGKRRWAPRSLLDGILWVQRTGASWREIPARFAPWHTVYDRYVRWLRDGTWARILAALLPQEAPG